MDLSWRSVLNDARQDAKNPVIYIVFVILSILLILVCVVIRINAKAKSSEELEDGDEAEDVS